MNEEKMTQCDRVVRYMTIHGSITPLEAITEEGILRLAARISDLKKQGYAIDTKMVKLKNRFGETSQVARYSFMNETRKIAPTTIPGFVWVDEALDDLMDCIKEVPVSKAKELNKCIDTE